MDYPTAGPPPGFVSVVEKLTVDIIQRCYDMAASEMVNFDIKPGNILVKHDEDFVSGLDVRITDYDSAYCIRVTDTEAPVKQRFFVTLLLLAVHLRAYGEVNFIDPFMCIAGPLLLELWEGIVSGHKGSDGEAVPPPFWLYNTSITKDPVVGSFDLTMLEKKTVIHDRLSLQLKMMVFEYLFDANNGKTPPRRAAEWTGWTFQPIGDFFSGHKPRLVPQLLRFAIFYNRPAPDSFNTLLAP